MTKEEILARIQNIADLEVRKAYATAKLNAFPDDPEWSDRILDLIQAIPAKTTETVETKPVETVKPADAETLPDPFVAQTQAPTQAPTQAEVLPELGFTTEQDEKALKKDEAQAQWALCVDVVRDAVAKLATPGQTEWKAVYRGGAKKNPGETLAFVPLTQTLLAYRHSTKETTVKLKLVLNKDDRQATAFVKKANLECALANWKLDREDVLVIAGNLFRNGQGWLQLGDERWLGMFKHVTGEHTPVTIEYAEDSVAKAANAAVNFSGALGL